MSNFSGNFYQTCLAKALYDNISESREELEFRRGDVVTVVEQDYNGIEGWWLCSLRGRQGLVPGNRLKIISGMYDAGGTSTQRKSWESGHNMNKQVVTPQKVGDVYIYDRGTDPDYDVPALRNINPVPVKIKNLDSQGNYDVPQRCSLDDQQEKNFNHDPPHPLKNRNSEGYDSNRSSLLSAGSGTSLSTSPSNTSLRLTSQVGSQRSSYGFEPSANDIYDVPISHSRPINIIGETTKNRSKELYDIPPYLKAKSDVQCGSYGSQNITAENFIKPFPGDLNENMLCDKNRSDPIIVNQSPVIKIDDHDYDVPVDGAIPRKKIKEGSQTNSKSVYDMLPSNNSINNMSFKGDSSSVYDIPPQVTRDVSFRDKTFDSLEVLEEQIRRMSTSSYDSSRSSDLPNIPYEELPIELDAAMDLLIKVQQELSSSVSRLLSYINSTWRKRVNLEPVLYDLKQSCLQFQISLVEFVSFGQGALANSTRASDKNLVRKLYKSLQPVLECHQTVLKAMKNLNDIDWSISELVQDVIVLNSADDLSQIITCARNISIDSRTLVSVIQGNSLLLFKRVLKYDEICSAASSRCDSPNKSGIQERPLPSPPSSLKPVIETLDPAGYGLPSMSSTPLKNVKSKEKAAVDDDNDYENDTREWLDDDDYIKMEWKEKMEQKLKNKRRTEGKTVFDPPERDISIGQNDTSMNVSSTADCGASSNIETCLTSKDKQLLSFYSNQLITYSTEVTNATDRFLNCIKQNHPPKIFVEYSKLVVLNAHKIVYVGDTLTRSLTHLEIKTKVMLCANRLCECLKQTVVATKNATFSYPSVTAVQELVDRVVEVSHAAYELKLVILTSASQN